MADTGKSKSQKMCNLKKVTFVFTSDAAKEKLAMVLGESVGAKVLNGRVGVGEDVHGNFARGFGSKDEAPNESLPPMMSHISAVAVGQASQVPGKV